MILSEFSKFSMSDVDPGLRIEYTVFLSDITRFPEYGVTQNRNEEGVGVLSPTSVSSFEPNKRWGNRIIMVLRNRVWVVSNIFTSSLTECLPVDTYMSLKKVIDL